VSGLGFVTAPRATTRLLIFHTNDHAEAEHFMCNGAEPVECAFGEEGSVLGPLALDHHGKESHREGVAVRAYRDHRGALADDKRFVVTGDADADATFAIAALCGYLSSGLDELAALINRMDTDPIGVRLCEHRWGPTLLLWEQLASPVQDATAFYAGVDRWRLLLGERPPRALIAAAGAQEEERVRLGREAAVEVSDLNRRVAFVRSAVWAFDLWYEVAPCVVALTPQGNVTVGCRDLATATAFFGEGGLKNVFPLLAPKGWGGRETVGGSPRGVPLTEQEARNAAIVIAGLVRVEDPPAPARP
jgi:hypothetical protein